MTLWPSRDPDAYTGRGGVGYPRESADERAERRAREAREREERRALEEVPGGVRLAAQLIDGGLGLIALLLVVPSGLSHGATVFLAYAIWWGPTDAKRWTRRAESARRWRGLAVRVVLFLLVVLALGVIGDAWSTDARLIALMLTSVVTWLIGLAVDRASEGRAAR